MALLEQAQCSYPCYRLRAILDAQFIEDVAGMPLDGVDSNDKLLVGSASRHQLEHFKFTITEWFDQRLWHRLWHRSLPIV